MLVCVSVCTLECHRGQERLELQALHAMHVLRSEPSLCSCSVVFLAAKPAALPEVRVVDVVECEVPAEGFSEQVGLLVRNNQVL